MLEDPKLKEVRRIAERNYDIGRSVRITLSDRELAINSDPEKMKEMIMAKVNAAKAERIEKSDPNG